MTEIEAKVKYVKLARSLRTYGVSFFLVKVSCKSYINLCPLTKIPRFDEVPLHRFIHRKVIHPQKVKNLAQGVWPFKINFLKRGAVFGISSTVVGAFYLLHIKSVLWARC